MRVHQHVTFNDQYKIAALVCHRIRNPLGILAVVVHSIQRATGKVITDNSTSHVFLSAGGLR
jgi:hypothetical protein